MTTPIAPLSSVLGTAPGTNTSAPAASNGLASSPANTLGKDAFLKLLVAQLRYQDPTNPTDSSQFMAQTAQFTQVEKLEEIAAANAEMLSAQSLLAVSGLVGRTVTYTGADGSPVSGVVTSASFGITGAVLRVGTAGTEIPVGAVTEIRQAANPFPASP
jgi:flagellar basal-body rod modification protein FlgD